MDEKWIQQTEKRYYRNLCDSIIETVKLMSMSMSELDRRITCNWEEFDLLIRQNKNGQAYLSHQFNWEWATVVANRHLPRKFTGIYLPLTNKVFDKLLHTIRSRAGMNLVKVQDMNRVMTSFQQKEIVWGFIADQNPSDPKRVSWNNFFHRKTAFFKGPEFVARRYQNPVFFGEIIRIRRGYYHIQIKLAFEHPQHTAEGEITEAYVRFLEESIKRQPDNWVWSHRRWKHQFPE
jgi:Kdo2-lipid IVA lauroyltransferase/acyltransferase